MLSELNALIHVHIPFAFTDILYTCDHVDHSGIQRRSKCIILSIVDFGACALGEQSGRIVRCEQST